ncbi:lipopolysaccharide biosynthesis protein [Novipirellula sp. SH528]|uniref:lipopolysaccharide biosynthesis protein n=1 Tax=Novipirellula sp. SH528 TaxID=3454466 RepID=UPI003F9EF549
MKARLRRLSNIQARIRPYLKESSWILIGQIASFTGLLTLVRVLTERMDPTEYGTLALGLTVAALINQVVMSGVIPGVARYYSIASEQQDLGGYLGGVANLLKCATAVVGLIGVILVAGLWISGFSHLIAIVLAALVLSVFQGCYSSLNGLQNAARQRSIVAFHNGAEAWLKILSVVVVAKFIGISSTNVILAYSFVSLIVTLSQLRLLRRTIPSSHPVETVGPSWTRQMATYSLPFATWGIFTWGQQVSDRWALEFFGASGDVGKYALLYQLGFGPILVITGLSMAFFGPILYERSGDASDAVRNSDVHRLGWKLAVLATTVTLFIFVATFVFHEFLFRILAAAEYREISYMLPWVVLAGGLYSTSQMLALKLMSEMRSADMTRAKIMTSLMAIALNLAGATIAGIQGVVASLLIFSIVSLIWMSVLAKQSVRTSASI